MCPTVLVESPLGPIRGHHEPSQDDSDDEPDEPDDEPRHSVVDIMYCSAARCYTHARCACSPAPCVRSMFVLPINLQVNAVFSLLALRLP